MRLVFTIIIINILLHFPTAQTVSSVQSPDPDQKPTVTELTIKSDVTARFANVRVRSVVVNEDINSHEVNFIVQMPKTAFISNFTMLIENELIIGQVSEKEKANKIYEKAKEAGKSAGHISQKPPIPDREMDIFNVNINIANKSSAIFELTYQELIIRKLGDYIQRISVQPNRIVNNLQIMAHYYEPQSFEHFHYSCPGSENGSDNCSNSVELFASPEAREIVYSPSVAEQRGIDSSRGIKGEFVVKYDISHKKDGGLIIVDNDYFVHYFSPSGLKSLDKNIIFVIDISGSMSGHKIEQVRDAMLIILGKLKRHDHFNIILFDSTMENWATEPMQANVKNVDDAKSYVLKKVVARGGTNINDALLSGISTLELSLSLAGNKGNIIVFLTDGQPTSGETNTKRIRKNVLLANEARVCIYSLGFGFNVNFDFLKKLSWENGGFARRIYEESDAAKQLEGFYDEISNPLLIDVRINYDNDVVDNNDVTDTQFPQYFNGTELVVAGRMKSDVPDDWIATVTGKSRHDQSHFDVSPQTIQPIGQVNKDFTERLWAYMKIKSLIKESSITDDKKSAELLSSRALNMSLKYNFVTPLTSMVVVQAMRDEGSDGMEHSLESVGQSKYKLRKKASYHKHIAAIADVPSPHYRMQITSNQSKQLGLGQATDPPIDYTNMPFYNSCEAVKVSFFILIFVCSNSFMNFLPF